MRLRIVVVALLLVSRLADADDPVPAAEVKTFDTQVGLPAVPSFELPPAEPGFVDPRYLRVRGKKLLDTQVKVKGYIIWIYDCIDDVRTAKQSRKQVQKLIDGDPTLCERPKFYLGSARNTDPQKGLWVVDVPRPPNKLEKQRLPKEDLAAWPKVPKYKLGDFVVVSGEFKTSSPHAERNSDGLIVFSAIEPANPVQKRAAPAAPAASTTVATQILTVPKPPPQRPVDAKTRDKSIFILNGANRAAGMKNFSVAVTLYQEAVKTWDGNHTAWYGLGGSLAAQGDWKSALDAFEHAVKLRPDVAMYQMWSGISSFESTVAQARIDQAKQQNMKPEDIQVDQSSLVFDASRRYLDLALAIEPKLWRAHYYRSKINRAADFARPAAENLTEAILADRTKPAPYVGLGELYRRWDYTDQAIAVMSLGTQALPAAPETSDVFYVLGMAYDDKHDYKKAIEAFTRALELNPDNYKAAFQRGQGYFKLKKYADAKRDLEAFIAAPGAQLAFAKQQAETMVMDMAARAK
jgi:tetratricopeptide (TPR) repeat protein